MSGQALYEDVVEFYKFGEHRTGYPADIATSEWISSSLAGAGYETELKEWHLRQFFLAQCSLKVNGEVIDSFPAWYPNPTPVTAALALYEPDDLSNLNGKIAYAGAAYGKNAGGFPNKLSEEVKAAGALGLILVSGNDHDTGHLAASNAVQEEEGGLDYHQSPLPLPTVLVAANDDAVLFDAASNGYEASIKIEGEDRTGASAFNVVATRKRGDNWIVVTTPSSGWFTCAGERGPGVALFLGLARWAARRDSDVSYMFIANSGHEIGSMGAHFTLDEYVPDKGVDTENVICWIHLGASIACRKWERTDEGLTPLDDVTSGWLQGIPDFVPLLKTAFADVKGYEEDIQIGSVLFLGELKHFINAGYNTFGFFGANTFFHQREDAPEDTGPELLEPVGKALMQVIEELEENGL